MEIVIHSDGVVNCVYGEAIQLGQLGQAKIRRASHVEPNEDGQWVADLSPVQGPQLGPYQNRTSALKAETGWLRNNWLENFHR
jgi:hypothetical protein